MEDLGDVVPLDNGLIIISNNDYHNKNIYIKIYKIKMNFKTIKYKRSLIKYS